MYPSDFEHWLNLLLYQIVALVSFTFCCVSIWKYYLKLQKVMKWIQHLCIFCSIIWMIAAIAWNINYLTVRACLLSNCDQVHFASILIAIYGSLFGYLGFILIFVLRLENLFRDSAFEIPTSTKKMIQLIIVFGACALFCSAVLYTIWIYFEVSGTWFTSIILFCFCMILYIIVSIILLKLMINQIRMFTKFTAGKDYSSSSLGINGNCFDEKKAAQITNYFDRLTKRLIVLYSIALFSSLIVECMLLIIFGLYLIEVTNGPFYRVFFEYFRLVLMIDTIINGTCLLLQSQNATQEYYHICSGCEKCIIPCCVPNLNQRNYN